ncbi:MAG: N-6 DNA methylase [Parabacteroides sp.]|nr:N-6 DNA methylase [Parabacteroides sp.]
MANPPFGHSREIEFIDHIISSLRTGGKAVIIVSEGFLGKTTPKYKKCRRKLLDGNCLKAVVSLPPGIFLTTQAKSSLLVLEKTDGNPVSDATSQVWFYDIANDGYTTDKNRRRTKEFPLPEAVKAFRERHRNVQKNRTAKSFFVSIKEIEANNWNLTYNRYKDFKYERQQYDLDEITEKITRADREIKQQIDELHLPMHQSDMSEQHDIVILLGRLQAITGQIEENIQLLVDLKKARFLQYFGDPVLDEKKFKQMVPLRELVNIYGGKNFKTRPEARQSEDEWAVLTQTAVTRREFDSGQNKICIEEKHYNYRHQVKKGDILFSRKNTLSLVGTTVYVYEETRRLLIPDTILRFECKPGEISGIYLTTLLNDGNFRKKLRNYTAGTLQSMANIAVTNLNNFNIPCPAPEQQKQFEEIILAIRQVEQDMRQQISQLRRWEETIVDKILPEIRETDGAEAELTTLLHTIDPESDKNDYTPFDEKPILRVLIRKIDQANNEIFPNMDTYNRARRVVFALLKKGSLAQVYNEENKRMEIHIA